jgi:hypothetical protein
VLLLPRLLFQILEACNALRLEVCRVLFLCHVEPPLLEYGFLRTLALAAASFVDMNRRMLLVMVVCRNRVLCVPWINSVVNLRHLSSPLR